jgi:hypothetical protein
VTEQEWLNDTDPLAMVEFLRGSPTGEDAVTWWNSRWRWEGADKGLDRKFRLFACACCRRIWDRIPEPCNRDAVVAVEDFLEGRLPAEALEAAFAASSAVEWKEDGSGRRSEPGYWAVKYLGPGFYKMTPAASALLVASQVLFLADEAYGREASHEFNCCYYAGNGVFLRPFRWPEPIPATVEAERAVQAALLCCIFGNPFWSAPTLAPGWLRRNDGTVTRLAQGSYDDRAFHRLPVLADALEEVGCHDTNILTHCRHPGPHVRGCWVVDLLLGKE